MGHLPPVYPEKLQNIIDLFEPLPEVERRETLVNYAASAPTQEPSPNATFNFEYKRQYEACAHKVAVYIQVA